MDALAKATGRAKFTGDLIEPGSLYASVLRSPYPHARILSVDTSMAERLPGVRAVLTGRDQPDRPIGVLIYDEFPIARDVARYVGEPVAAVAADTPDVAAEAIALIDVEYAELPAVFDAEPAASPDCPVLVHPHLAEYERASLAGISSGQAGATNIFFEWKIRQGDTDRAFRDADLIVENRYSLQRISHGCLELHQADAWTDSDGMLTIRSTRQGAGLGKPPLCRFFDLDDSQVRLLEPYVGGAFGGKTDLLIEHIAAMLAQKAGRPVTLAMTRKEVLSTICRGAFVIYVKDGVAADGTLIARDLKVLLDIGAYSQLAIATVRNACFGAVGTYRVPNFKWHSQGIYTNQCPATALRGFGTPEVHWALEQQMDIIAEKLGIDPVELRLKNVLREGERNAQGQLMHSIGAEGCLKKIADWLKWGEPPAQGQEPWKRAKGLSLVNKYTSAGTTSGAFVKVHRNRVLEVRHGLDELGQGLNTVVAQIAAEEFGIPIQDVRIVRGDTAFAPYDWASVGSRSTWHLGHATLLACQDAKRQILAMAANRLEIGAQDLELSGWRVCARGSPDRSIPVADLFSPQGFVPVIGEIVGRGEYTCPKAPEDPETGQSDRAAAFFAYGACGVELAVNEATGEVEVEKIASCFDMGQPINPLMCEQQIEGGIVQGMGSTLYEEMVLRSGEVLNSNLTDYRMPTTLDVPIDEHVEAILAPVSHEEGPFGAKALGEAVLGPIAPAIANAFYNATGTRIKDLPLTMERVWEAVKNGGQG
ncbi:MAG: xanthine dehydrogenase family protein molybdopterin-binding subunit [Chloroflexi bacterium]|nr:xanthine dehydrogenase family protein molybdopterin-binding subunit [Chloroflexota bacterium]